MRPKSRTDFAVAIICALPLEADAVEAVFDENYDRLGKFYGKQPGDVNSYVNGRIGNHNIVLCYMPGMGKGSAASVASTLGVSYTGIQLALVVGICGAAPYPSSDTQIFLGDVIVSEAVVEYDFGRQYPGGFQRKTDVKNTLGRPDRKIRTLLNGLKARQTRIEFQGEMLQHLRTIQQSETSWQHPVSTEDVLFEASYHHKHYDEGSSAKCCCFNGDLPDDICEEAQGKTCNSLGCDENRVSRRRDVAGAVQASVYIGTVASADMVMKSGEHRDKIAREEKVIGFEMEGAGVWDNISCIIIKGVCDYADSHKSKAWQAYAAATGASATKAFLEYWRPSCREEREHHWMVPFGRNPRFVGRHDEITQVERLILQPDGPTRIAISGLGGIGKTQVVLHLAYRIRERDAECSIFWIPCTGYESVEQAYMSIAQRVGIQDVKSAEAKERVRNYFNQKSAGKWLLIFDNADDMDMWIKGSNAAPALKDFLPQNNEQGHIIFTTRNRKLAVRLASCHVISIPELDEPTGMQILEESLIRKDLLDDKDTAISFLKELTFLPLAITQAAAYVNENDIGLADYIALLQEQESDVVKLLSEDFEDEGRYTNIQNPIATTWLVSLQQIQNRDQLAAGYLSFMGCINSRNIPQSLLPQSTTKMRIEAIGLLKAYSFISEQAGDGSLSLHRLVRLITRNWMRKNQQFAQCIYETADRLDEVFPDDSHINRQLWREYLPHALSLVGESEFQKQQEKYISLLWDIGTCLYSDGRYGEAAVLFGKIMSIQQRTDGDTNLFTLNSMDRVASTYWKQGRWKEAEELVMQVMKTRKQMLGSKHPDTLISMSNLAITYMNQRRWKEAEELGMQVMKASKQVLEPEHSHTLNSMNNLTITYCNQGRWKEAEELGMQVVKTRKQVLGSEHPDTLTSMGNLAITYRNQGRWKEAEELEMQVMKTRKQILGSEHPDTLTSMSNLATTYMNQGRWKEAEELKMQVMKTRKQILGSEHSDTLISMSNLTITYMNQRR